MRCDHFDPSRHNDGAFIRSKTFLVSSVCKWKCTMTRFFHFKAYEFEKSRVLTLTYSVQLLNLSILEYKAPLPRHHNEIRDALTEQVTF